MIGSSNKEALVDPWVVQVMCGCSQESYHCFKGGDTLSNLKLILKHNININITA